eukprot:801182-Amphidinium_carterae.1
MFDCKFTDHKGNMSTNNMRERCEFFPFVTFALGTCNLNGGSQNWALLLLPEEGSLATASPQQY